MVVAFIMRERHTDVVTRLLDRWNDEGITLHSPLLALYEVATALTRRRVAGFSAEDVDEALALAAGLHVRYHPMTDIARVVEMAVELERHDAYDMPYLALAERLDTVLWTLDGPLARNAGGRGYRVKLID